MDYTALHRSARIAAVMLAVACQLTVGYAGWMAPKLNWDMLAYSAILKSWEGDSSLAAHDAAYEDARQFSVQHHQGDRWANLIDGDDYRRAMATDNAAFSETLLFYRVRPLYVALVGAVSSVTDSVTKATILVSAISSTFSGLLILAFGIETLGALAGAAASILFALSPPIAIVASLSTPDSLLTLSVTLAAILFLRGALIGAATLLLAATFIRTDIALFNLCLCAGLLLSGRYTGYSRQLLVPAFILALSFFSVKMIEWAESYPGYEAVYRFTLVDGFVTHPLSLVGKPIPLIVMARLCFAGVHDALANGGLWLFLALATPAAFLCFRDHRPIPPLLPAILGALVCYMAARFGIFPSPQLRLIAPSIGMATVVLVASMQPVIASPKQQTS